MRVTITGWTAGSLAPRIYDDTMKIVGIGSSLGSIDTQITYFSVNPSASISGSPKTEIKPFVPLAQVKIGVYVSTADPITYSVDYQLLP